MMLGLVPRERRVLAPGAVHVPDWLDLDRQRMLVRACREWASDGPGIRAAVLPNGGQMSVRTVCLGWHWVPYRYGDPDRARTYQPDIALINHYAADARMGLHRDSDERSPDPVVSFSIGAACVFRFGNTEHRGRPWTDVELHSGDLVVFGDESRLAYHGVPKLLPAVEVPDTGLASGRLNITLRVSGLA
jgi:alkylated DNA repair protein (DNA oxidative demethylase)